MHLHPLLHYHAFGARDAFMCITVCMHSERDAYKCIWMHANALHSDAFRLWCIHVHYRIHAFWTWCIQMHFNACKCVAFGCIPTMMHLCA